MASFPNESQPDALAELSGTVLERRYELGSVLGKGGMGAVFEARHLRLDRTVAIKVLRPVFVGHDQYIRRFLREAKSASKIRHRNVVEILDYGEAEGGLVYSVMEFLVGEDLENLLRRQPAGHLPWSTVCGLLVQIASGLKAAHVEGVIHRDIKPANCFLTQEDGEPLIKLVDFGIAKVDDADQTYQLTGTAQVLGTPNYIAPELVRTNQAASAQSDIYSLGVLAYRMLTGQLPFRGDTVFELLRRACFDPVPSLCEIVPSVPASVERFVLEMLAKEPTDRPANMHEVRERLRQLGGETVGSQTVEISPSDALPLDDEADQLRDSMERTVVQRDVESPVPLPMIEPDPIASRSPDEIDGPEAQDTVVHGRSFPRARPSMTQTPVTEHVPAKVVAQVSGAPLQPVDDPSSSPSRSGATAPTFGDAILRMDDVGALEQPGRKRGLWLGVALVAVLCGVGALVLPAMLEHGLWESRRSVQNATEESKTEGEEVEAQAEGGSEGTPSVAVDATDPESSGGAMMTGAVEPAMRPEAIEELEPALAEPEPEPEPESAKPQASSKKKRPTKPTGPAKDSSIIQRLKRKIGKRCSNELEAGAVTVSFIISPSGQMLGLDASPMDTRGKCATSQVRGTEFRPRADTTPQKFTVK